MELDQAPWTDLMAAFDVARRSGNLQMRDQVRDSMRNRLTAVAAADAAWLVSAFLDVDTREFALDVLRLFWRDHGYAPINRPPPRDLQMSPLVLEPLVCAAVYEINPSFNRQFVNPAFRAFGFRSVLEELLKYIERGSNFEKAGAVNASYWITVWRFDQSTRQEVPRIDEEELADLWERLHVRMIEEFVRNEDVEVQRSLIALLSLGDQERVPASARHLVPEAIRIARGHDDPYIQSRVRSELDAGGYPPSPPLPHRE